MVTLGSALENAYKTKLYTPDLPDWGVDSPVKSTSTSEQLDADSKASLTGCVTFSNLQDMEVRFYSPDEPKQEVDLPVKRVIITEQLDINGKPILTGGCIALKLQDSNEVLEESSASIENNDDNASMRVLMDGDDVQPLKDKEDDVSGNNDDNASMRVLMDGDDVQPLKDKEDDVSGNNDDNASMRVLKGDDVSDNFVTVMSIRQKPGIISKVVGIFKKSNKQIAQNSTEICATVKVPPKVKEIRKTVKEIRKTVKEIRATYDRFYNALHSTQFYNALHSTQSFEGIQASLKDEKFLEKIVNLKFLGSSKEDVNLEIQDVNLEIQEGLQLFKQMMKALEFIDVATLKNSAMPSTGYVDFNVLFSVKESVVGSGVDETKGIANNSAMPLTSSTGDVDFNGFFSVKESFLGSEVDETKGIANNSAMPLTSSTGDVDFNVLSSVEEPVKLNSAQIQMVTYILEGTADPLNGVTEECSLGRGAYGTVNETKLPLLGKNYEYSSGKEHPDHYAIKSCTYKKLDESYKKKLNTAKLVEELEAERKSLTSNMDALKNEYDAVMKFDHPNIIKPIYAHDRVLYMELAKGGPLYQKFHKMKGEQLVKTLSQTADALAYIHEQGYVHGDVKNNNIFLTEEFDAKVGDFGLCQHCDDFHFNFKGCYSFGYFPPECLSGAINDMDKRLQKEAALKMDSWSFGAMLWSLLPKYGENVSLYYENGSCLSKDELMYRIDGDHAIIQEFNRVYCDIIGIMCDCLDPDFKTRPRMAEVRDCFNVGVSLSSSMIPM